MKILLIIFAIMMAFPTFTAGDTIILKDGRKIEGTTAWEDDGKVNCTIMGGTISFPKENVRRIEKGLDKPTKNAPTDNFLKEGSKRGSFSPNNSSGPALAEEDLFKILTEMEKAKAYIGKFVWSKRKFRNPYIDDKNVTVEVESLERLEVVDVGKNPNSEVKSFNFYSSKEKKRVEITYQDYPLRIYLRKENKLITFLDFSTVYSGDKYECLAHKYLFFEDPHKLHPNWSQRVWDAIRDERLFVGMSKDMVLMSWGEPMEINRSIGSWGTDEQWVYPAGFSNGNNYLYLRNEIVTSFQLRD